MLGTLNPGEEAQLRQTIEMFEVITQSQPTDYQSLEILKEAYLKLEMEPDVIQTSKRIAEAYVQLGQLSSAILEYETILQRHPEDPDALAAMAQLENKANTITAPPPDLDLTAKPAGISPVKKTALFGKPDAESEIDDGRETMFKIFVEGKYITAGDFDASWQVPNLKEPPPKASEPFIHILNERAIIPLDKSLKLISDRSRIAYVPIERYDIEMDLARGFPKDVCRRWCILPFDKMSKSILVATANPFNRQAAMDLERATKTRLLWYLTSPVDLMKVLGKVFR